MSDLNKEYLISPRSCAIKNKTQYNKYRFMKEEVHIEYVICSSCKFLISKKAIPIKSINNFFLEVFLRN